MMLCLHACRYTIYMPLGSLRPELRCGFALTEVSLWVSFFLILKKENIIFLHHGVSNKLNSTMNFNLFWKDENIKYGAYLHSTIEACSTVVFHFVKCCLDLILRQCLESNELPCIVSNQYQLPYLSLTWKAFTYQSSQHATPPAHPTPGSGPNSRQLGKPQRPILYSYYPNTGILRNSS